MNREGSTPELKEEMKLCSDVICASMDLLRKKNQDKEIADMMLEFGGTFISHIYEFDILDEFN